MQEWARQGRDPERTVGALMKQVHRHMQAGQHAQGLISSPRLENDPSEVSGGSRYDSDPLTSRSNTSGSLVGSRHTRFSHT